MKNKLKKICMWCILAIAFIAFAELIVYFIGGPIEYVILGMIAGHFASHCVE